MIVRMLHYISGGRADGRPWPPGGATIDVSDDEGRDLIIGGNAIFHAQSAAPARTAEIPVQVSAPAATAAGPVTEVAAPDLAAGSGAQLPEAQAGDVPAEAAGEPAEAAAEPDAVAAGTSAAAPAPSAPKQAWIDWAVYQGADVHEAGAMTKVDLMSRYGGRL